MPDPGESYVHPAARKGFGEEASAYSRGRPRYPDTLLPWIRDQLGVGSGVRALDLGAGTGKFTELLVRSGARVFALEPVQAMRTQLEREVPNAETLEGTAQAIPLDTESIDAVTCAQSFHWFATRAALKEIHRVLAPGGRLGLIWNVRDESVAWVAAITKLLQPYEGDTPRFHQGTWRAAFTGDLFSTLTETQFAHRHKGSAQAVIIDRFMSVSFVASLPTAEKVAVKARLESLIRATPELNEHAEIVFPYRTYAFVCRRL